MRPATTIVLALLLVGIVAALIVQLSLAEREDLERERGEVSLPLLERRDLSR